MKLLAKSLKPSWHLSGGSHTGCPADMVPSQSPLCLQTPWNCPLPEKQFKEAASPTSQLVKSRKRSTGLQHSNGRLSILPPWAQKHCREGKGRPSHSQPVPESKYLAPLQLSGQSYIPSTSLSTSVCDGTQMLRTGLLSPQGPQIQGHKPPPAEATSVLADTAGPFSVPLIPSLIVQMQGTDTPGPVCKSEQGCTPWPHSSSAQLRRPLQFQTP